MEIEFMECVANDPNLIEFLAHPYMINMHPHEYEKLESLDRYWRSVIDIIFNHSDLESAIRECIKIINFVEARS